MRYHVDVKRNGKLVAHLEPEYEPTPEEALSSILWREREYPYEMGDTLTFEVTISP